MLLGFFAKSISEFDLLDSSGMSAMSFRAALLRFHAAYQLLWVTFDFAGSEGPPPGFRPKRFPQQNLPLCSFQTESLIEAARAG